MDDVANEDNMFEGLFSALCCSRSCSAGRGRDRKTDLKTAPLHAWLNTVNAVLVGVLFIQV